MFSPTSGLHDQFSKEKDAITASKAFLRRQRQSLKRRQVALQAAKQELMKDIVKQKQGVGVVGFQYSLGFAFLWLSLIKLILGSQYLSICINTTE